MMKFKLIKTIIFFFLSVLALCSCNTQKYDDREFDQEYIPGQNQFRQEERYGPGTNRDAYGARSRSFVPEGFSNGY